MSDWLLFLIPLAAFAAVVVWDWQRKPKDLGPSFRPWYVRLKPRQKK